MRRALLRAVTGLTLLLPAAALPASAQAHSASAAAGGVRATLSYTGGPGITTRNERLTIVRGGRPVYEAPVPSQGCFQVCGLGATHPVAVAPLYGRGGGEDVVLTLWNGGADCCVIADVYVPSAATRSYVLDQQNFGEAGFELRDIGPRGRPEFISADAGFYCKFTACAASALPVQVFEFSAERFVDVTRQHPALIRADAAHWLRLYRRDPRREVAAIAAWAGDEDHLGPSHQAAVRTALQRQYADHNLTLAFVKSLERFLRAGHYSS